MIARLRFVRHAEAALEHDDRDPGLSLDGARAALALSRRLQDDPPERLRTSPSRRARETALPLAAAFGLEREIEPAYDELPWLEDGQTVLQRQADIRRFVALEWTSISPELNGWRERLIDAARAERGDAVIVSHFVAINTLVGHVRDDPRTMIFRPANASVTEFELTRDGLRLVSLGEEMV